MHHAGEVLEAVHGGTPSVATSSIVSFSESTRCLQVSAFFVAIGGWAHIWVDVGQNTHQQGTWRQENLEKGGTDFTKTMGRTVESCSPRNWGSDQV